MNISPHRASWLCWFCSLFLCVSTISAIAQEAPADEPAPTPEAAPATVSPSPLSALPSGSNVAIIPIEGMIYDFVLDSLKRRVERALDSGATVIILEIDTYGGVVTSALEISKYLKNRTEVPVPTIAWVNNKAYSAGIMIASACDEIIMAPSSATGDCAPIVPGQELAPTERAKAFSPIATEFKNSAANNGYTYATFHAMCVLGVELYYIEHKDTGQRKLVNQADYQIMVRGDTSAWNAPTLPPPTTTAPPAAPTNPTPSPAPTTPSTPSIPGMPSPANTPAPAPAAPPVAAPTTIGIEAVTPLEAGPADVGAWKIITTLPSGASLPNGRVHDGQTLFTVDEITASDIGLSKATVATDADLAKHLGAATVSRVNHTWSEDLAAFLTSPAVRAVLILALVLGAYMEFQSPGLGFPGAVAALALIALLGAPMVVGLAEIWHILMFLAGMILLIIELLFTPTFGILGIVGIVMMLAGIVLSIVPSGGGPLPTPSPVVWERLLSSLISTLVGFFLSIGGFIILTKYFGQIPFLNRLILGSEGVGTDTHAPVSGQAALGDGTMIVGQVGRVVSTLRPAGEATFDGKTVDVVSVGPMIDVGQPVRIIEVGKFTITVDAAADE